MQNRDFKEAVGDLEHTAWKAYKIVFRKKKFENYREIIDELPEISSVKW